jgi:hypothetical protein
MNKKKFAIESIKMDLHRVATMVGYINKSISIVSVMEFIHHAELDFNKLELNKH